jgi:hypothetical protein
MKREIIRREDEERSKKSGIEKGYKINSLSSYVVCVSDDVT